jgi:hypothetical protein
MDLGDVYDDLSEYSDENSSYYSYSDADSDYEEPIDTNNIIDHDDYYVSDHDDDSDYEDPSFQNNDSSNTTNPPDNNLLESCSNMFKDKFPAHSSGRSISIDCDAFSYLVTVKAINGSSDLDPQKKKAIKRFLLVFGQQLSTIAFPSSEVAAHKADSVFGSSKNVCQHVKSSQCGDLLQSSESLVISSPVKIAVHQSCRKNIVQFLNKNAPQTFAEVSPNLDLCINHNFRGNLPCYGSILEAVLSNCYVQEADKFIIHIANIGTRYPIPINEDEDNPCQVRRLFYEVDLLRRSGIAVETTQLDIAFNIPIVGKFLQWSHYKTQKNNHSISTIYQKATTEIWAIHDLKSTCDNNIITCPNKLQQGTLRLKQKDWQNAEHSHLRDHYRVPLTDDGSDDDYVMNSFWDPFMEQNFSSVKINNKSIHSIKFYSTVSHIMRSIQNIMPLNFPRMDKLHQCTFRKLQLMLKSMEITFNKALNFVNDVGICARTEISVRPGTDDLGKHLRLNGTLTDFLVHLHVAMNDLFCQELHVVKLHCVDTEIVRSKLQSFIQELEPSLSFRNSLRFCDLHTETKVQEWLKCQMNIIMTLGGIAPDFNLKYVVRWLRDPSRHDPYRQSKLLSDNFLSIHSDTDIVITDDKIQEIPTALINECQVILVNAGLSKNGAKKIIHYIQNPLSTTTHCNSSLSLRDKLILSDKCHCDIIPQLHSLKIAKENRQVAAPSRTINTFHGDKWLTKQYKENDRLWLEYRRPYLLASSQFLESSLRLTQGRSHQHGRKKTPTSLSLLCPIMSVVNQLVELTQCYDLQDPLYIYRLYNHISRCHEQQLVIRNNIVLKPLRHQEGLQHYSSSFDVAVRAIEHNRSDHQSLMNILHGLGVGTQHARNKIAFVAKLAAHYFFPCFAGVPDIDVLRLLSRPTLQNLSLSVNSSLQHEFVIEIPHHNIRQRHFYRASENLHIFIIPQEVLIASPAVEPRSLFASPDLYSVLDHCFIPKSSAGNESRLSLYKHFKEANDLSKSFLCHDATMNCDFGMAQSLDDLQQIKSFSLLYSDSLEKFNNICPEVIIPSAALRFATNIFFVDYPSCSSHLHVYLHSCSKVITYKLNGTDFSPKLCCHQLSLRLDNNFEHVTRQLPPNQDYDAFVFANTPLFSIDNCTMSKTFKRHPQGEPTNTRNGLSLTILALLRTEEISHHDFLYDESFQQEDPLYLCHYIEELNSFYNDVNLHQFFSSDIISVWDMATTSSSSPISSDSKLRDLVCYIQNNDLDTLHHSFLCSLLCLKYKLWFAVWENSNGILRTTFYAFNTYNNRVEIQVQDNFIYKQRELMYLYLKYSNRNGRITTGYWRAADNNPFTALHTTYSAAMLLQTPYSYLDGPAMLKLLAILKNSLGINVISSSELSHPVTQGHSHPIMMICRMYNKNLWLDDHLLAVFYPCSNETKISTAFFLSSAPMESIKEESCSLMNKIGDANLPFYDTFYHRFEKLDFATSFMIINIMYAAHLCPNTFILTEVISELQHKVDVIKQTKIWISLVLSGVTDVTSRNWLTEIVYKYNIVNRL